MQMLASHAYYMYIHRYAGSLQLNEKSDVYSFGVVLLEVITGQPTILESTEVIHIVQWARLHLSGGNIEEVVDG